jgi:hypothetical protein
MTLLPVATGIAILRHNLYDIDRIINRTLVYVPLTAILAGLFVAVTGLIRTIFTDLTDAGSDAAIAISTLTVVAVLTPVKNQLQAFVDRHFKQQHDPQKALSELVGEGRLVARVLDEQRFVASMLEQITAAFQLKSAALELVSNDGRQPAYFGRADEGTAVEVPLVHLERPVGTLRAWLSLDSTVDAEALAEALTEPADVLAQVVSVIPLQTGSYATA